MKKRPPVDPADVESLQRELDEAQAALRAYKAVDEARRRLEALSDALIGAVDPETVFEHAERWAVATLGVVCSIAREAPERGSAFPLGGTPPVAWLVIEEGALDAADHAAIDAVIDRLSRAVRAADRVDTQAIGMRALERSLLPDALLAVPGLQLASRYVPAKGSHDVGGDFYDAIRIGKTATLIVGDVQGKGIEAATLTSMARHTLRAAALGGHPPDELLRQLNRALIYAQEEQLSVRTASLLRFVTAAVAQVEPVDAGGFHVTVARAGQPPPIIVRGDGTFEALEPRGVLLGVSQDPDYETATTHLEVGDTLVLYTDGVIEQRGGANGALSEHHLGMLVRNRRGVVDAESIASLIEETVHLVAPEEIRDDVAILVACAIRT